MLLKGIAMKTFVWISGYDLAAPGKLQGQQRDPRIDRSEIFPQSSIARLHAPTLRDAYQQPVEFVAFALGQNLSIGQI